MQRKPTLMEEVEFLKNEVVAQKQALNSLAEEYKRNLTQMLDILNGSLTACKKLLPNFEDEVKAEMTRVGEERVKQFVAASNERLNKLVEAGTFTVGTEVTDTSLIVAREFNKEGKVVNHFLQNFLADYNPEFRAKLLGQSPGFCLDLPEGKIELLGVYEPVVAKESAGKTK